MEQTERDSPRHPVICPPLPQTNSTETLQSKRDYSLWHEEWCRPLIIQTIQGKTTSAIQGLIESENHLKDVLRGHIELRREEQIGGGLVFLDWASDVECTGLHSSDIQSFAQRLVSFGASRTSVSSAISRSSNTSFASQVSDSYNNEVEQSVELFLQDLKLRKDALLRREKEKLPRWPPPVLVGDAKALHDAMDAAISQIKTARPDMTSIGFADLGLDLNSQDKMFREPWLKYLQNALNKGEVRSKLYKGKVRNILSDRLQLNLLKQLMGALGISSKDQGEREGYPALTQTLEVIMADVGKIIQRGIDHRDSLLASAYPLMDDLVRDIAESCGVEVVDQFIETKLVKRVFGEPRVLGLEFRLGDQTF